MRKPFSLVAGKSLSVVGADNKRFGQLFTEPYRNVMRMHMLIFFFFFAHFARLENFAVYAVIYAVYFFPWRLLRRAPEIATSFNAASRPVNAVRATPSAGRIATSG